MRYLVVCMFALSAEAAWMQLPATPPGTNDVSRVEPTPAPTQNPEPAPAPVEGVAQPVPAVPGAGVVGGMVAVPVPSGTAAGAGGGGISGGSGAPPARGGGGRFVPGAGGSGGGVAPGRSAGGAGGAAGGVGGRAGSAQPAANESVAPDCSAKFGKVDENVGALGGAIDLPVSFSTAACVKAPRAEISWARVAASGGGLFRFNVDPNPSATQRQGSIVLGDQRFVIRQEGGKLAMLAVSPARVLVGVNGRKVTKSGDISVWAEDPALSYTVAPVGYDGLRVKAVKSKDPKRRNFTIELDTARLRRGRHDAEVRIAATGVVNPPLVIPVVIEVR